MPRARRRALGMSNKEENYSRRDFLKTASAVGIGSMLAPLESLTNAQTIPNANESQSKIVSTRPFGKTGADVSILGLGGAFHWSNLRLINQALKMGVTYWDTAPRYGNGQSEEAIGKYFEKFPDDRKKVFLVTKSGTLDIPSMKTSLNNSLRIMKTSYIDLYLLHGIADLYDIKNEMKAWAEREKASGKIRYFGFSTHTNMERCLLVAAKMGWIDGIMLTYNFRVMQTEMMKKAVDACFKAGIGLTAMKTQATGWATSTKPLDDRELNLLNQFEKKGLTAEQGKLKAVWDNYQIASICSHMTNMTTLQANVAAAVDDKNLSLRDKKLMNQYALHTASNYCAGCAAICESEINSEVPISDIMRFLMYYRCYGDLENAKIHFNDLPLNVRKRMTHIDYTQAERKCPQHMKIGQLMRDATIELA
jgi:predicted aldo/keto reductase-like oxidoreductase